MVKFRQRPTEGRRKEIKSDGLQKDRITKMLQTFRLFHPFIRYAPRAVYDGGQNS